MATQVRSELLPWQNKRFRKYELPWTKAVESLLTDDPLIEVLSNKDGSRWSVMNKATNKLAVFSHAGLWCWASPPDTGNFVPEGESAPEGVLSSRVLRTLSRRIETSYAINTEEDPSFYDSAKILEDHATSLKGFNKHKKPRRTWQSGDDDFLRRRFIFSSRLVLRRTPLNSKDGAEPPLSLHPWLYAALKAQRYPVWIANPEMPRLMDTVDGKLQTLKPTSSHRYFNNGDIVWFSFVLTFDVNSSNWLPEYKPLDFIRVGNLPQSSYSSDYSVADALVSVYQSLADGTAIAFDENDEADMVVDDDTKPDLKRTRDSDGDDTMSDSGLSDKSAYSAALAALDEPPPAKRPKVEETSSSKSPSSSAKPPSSKAAIASEEISKRKPSGKSKVK